ncbi:complement C3-like [Diadema setosum]|uniref:complement C3-like n=1 Tax=Diadema setosum TaxID=31175 RepID=UPI003B3AD2B3
MKVLGLLGVLCFLVVAVHPSLQQVGREKIVITAPNVFRVGVNETVTVAVFNTNEDISVTIYLEEREQSLAWPYSSSTVTVRHGSPVTTTVKVEPEHMPAQQENGEQYVYLVARSTDLNNFQEEKQILVSSRAGYLLVQTDKPIYTPNQEVKIRVVAVDQEMRPSSELMHLQVRNPQGIIVQQFRETRVVNGFLDKTFGFNAEPMFGNWSVTVLHGLQFQKNRTILFEVKEYVLPRFTITINTPDFIVRGTRQTVSGTIAQDMQEIDITFEARYVYKKPVEGTFHMTIGILQSTGDVVHVREVAASGELINGVGTYVLVPSFEFGPNWFEMYKGCKLIVEVKVTEQTTGVTEKAVDATTPIVSTPYRFKREETVMYYKPGLPYVLQFELETVTGNPAQNVPISFEAFAQTRSAYLTLYNSMDSNNQQLQTDFNGRVRVVVDTTLDSQMISVRVSARKPDNQDQNVEYEDTVFDFDATPYDSETEDYLVLRVDQEELRVGDGVYATIQSLGRSVIDYVSLMFIAQGKILSAETVLHGGGERQEVFFRITPDMIPTVRVVAYYIHQMGHIVADSVWLKVEKTCRHHVGLNVRGSADEDGSYLPENPVTLLVDALPSSYVGILGVDKAVYALNDGHRITRKKMFDMMQSYDLGCGPGSGLTTAMVFKDAGLAVLTNAQLAVPAREALSCTQPSTRRRRNAIDGEVSLQDKLASCLNRLQSLCDDNLSDNKMGNKIQRWNYCSKISSKLRSFCPSASEADLLLFRECCDEKKAVPMPKENMRTLPRASDDDDVFSMDVRTDFRETWLFDLVHVGATGQESLEVVTPGSITEWSLQAISVTPSGGFCVAEPVDVNVFKKLSVQLQLPYSVVHLEQIEVLASIYNYHSQEVEVEVSFYGSKTMCGESTDPSQPARRTLVVAGNDSQSLKFVIIPLETGDLPIRFTASSNIGSDGVEKMLNVIPQGTPQSMDHTVLLDPSGVYRQPRHSTRLRAAIVDDLQSDQVVYTESRRQFNVVDLRPPENVIPETVSAYVSLIGNMLGPIAVDPIENFGTWLDLPRGCGEQTTSIVAPAIFILKYLKAMKLTNTTLEEQAMIKISEGLGNTLVHRRTDGSFAIWGNNSNYNSSTWLTAFVLKVFSHADELTPVDRAVTCNAGHWLVRNAQNPNGSFSELYEVHHKEMTGGISGEAAMTAYVLISLLESPWCDSVEQDLGLAIQRAKRFLEMQVNLLTRPYSKAIVAYALALADSEYATEANRRLKSDAFNNQDGSRHWAPAEEDTLNQDMPHWYRVRPTAIAVETTAYALLTQLALREITYAGSVALWLSEQQNYQGGFVSTQDSVIALQALIKYVEMAHNGDDIDLTCILTSDADESFRFEHHILPHNALVQEEVMVPIGGRLRSECSGKGTGKLMVKMKFNRVANSGESCPFEVTYEAHEARNGAMPDPVNSRSRVAVIRRSTTTAAQMARAKGDFVAEISFCARYTENTRTNMGIIDVGLYSGFVLVEDQLEEMVNADHRHLVRRFEVSQRSVIFYLDRIPADQSICIRFNARREMHVGNVQPVATRVYDYYSPDKSCTTFYHPLKGSSEIQTLCNDESECVCPTERCTSCDREPVRNLVEAACASDEHFALRVSIAGQDHDNGYTVLTGNVTRVLKTGVDAILPGSLRLFYVKEQCDCPKIKVRNEYTIIGSTSLRYVREDGLEGYKYLLDKRSIVESWPTKLHKRRNLDVVAKLGEFEVAMETGCT